jgi:hypothetical protein
MILLSPFLFNLSPSLLEDVLVGWIGLNLAAALALIALMGASKSPVGVWIQSVGRGGEADLLDR